MMLMGGVICLANAQIQVQIAWAGAYIAVGAAYWIVAALPGKVHWDTSCYKVTNECLSDSKMDVKGYPSINETFTQALWKAIVVSKSTIWVERSDACPRTQAWTDWLHEARACSGDVKECKGTNPHVKTWEVPDWDPQKALNRLLDEEAGIRHRVKNECVEVLEV
jgi:hypothetical protein